MTPSLLPLLLLGRAEDRAHTLGPQALEAQAVARCPSLDESPALTMVWAWSNGVDANNLSQALQTTSKARPNEHTRLYCGNGACMDAAAKAAASGVCVTPERLFVQELAKGTPAEEWCRCHVLAKVLAGPDYEKHLQVVMQLAALWKHGGIVVQPGASPPADAAAGEMWIGTNGTGDTWDKLEVVTPEHGLRAISAGSVNHPGVESMLSALVKQYPPLSRMDPLHDYDRKKWPLIVDWKLVVDQASSKATARKVDVLAAMSKSALPTKFGIYSFYQRHHNLLHNLNNSGMNVGDEMQQLAGLQFMPRVDTFVERDDMKTSWAEQGVQTHNRNDSTLLFANAWYDKTAAVWPPPENINPVMVALHFEKEAPNLYTKESAAYLSSHWPVGTRDEATRDNLVAKGIPAFHSGDMTFTLQPMCDREALKKAGKLTKTVVIDVDADVLKQVVPDEIIKAASIGSHKALAPSPSVSHELARYASAYEHVYQYACEAKLLITQRLHAALPASSMGTPVLLIDDAATLPGGGGASGEARLRGLEKLVHTATVKGGLPAGFNFENPPPNPNSEERTKLVHRLHDTAACHDSTLADAAIKFGALPHEFASLTADTRTCDKDAPDNAIHITTAVDKNILTVGQGVAFASWANSLGATNNGETLIIHLLVDGLTKAQQCMARVLLRRHLSSTSQVYTIPVDKLLDESTAHYEGLKHVTRITMARLMMPKLLPCVKKTLWVDVDTLVLKPLSPLFALEATTPCGIAGKSSILFDYTAKSYQGPDKAHLLKLWSDGALGGFNAGVILVDLDVIRSRQRKYDDVVQMVAVELGNDDQVTLNLFCQGNFTHFDAKWNVFHFSGKSSVPDPELSKPMEEWGIFHFNSGNKPWLAGATFANANVESIWKRYATNFWGEWNGIDMVTVDTSSTAR